MKLHLQAWGNAWLHYILDPSSGKHALSRAPDPLRDKVQTSGFASMEPVMGLFFRFYAAYAHDGRLYVQAGKQRWDLTNVSIETDYWCRMGLISGFRLKIDGTTAHRVTLVHPTRAGWAVIDPTYDCIDFESDHFLAFLAGQLMDEEWREHLLSMKGKG